MSNILDNAIPRLFSKYPFYAHLYATKVRKIEKNDLPAPMGVCFKDGKIQLFYNPKFILEKQMDLRAISDIIYHELRHVVNGHVFMSERKGHIWNVAMDLEINKDLEETAEKYGVTVKTANQKFNLKMEENKSCGYYYPHLYKQDDDNVGNTLDDHSMFDESDKGDVAQQELSQTIKETFESFKKVGSITEGLLEELEGHLKSKVNWKKQLRNIVCNALNTTRRKTRARVNRRLGWLLQGSKKDDFFTIVFCVDTSGSMSTESLSQCWAELCSIYKNIKCEIKVIEADSKIHKVKDFNPKDVPTFSGRGGTAYSPALEKAKEFKPSLILYYGDMDSADVPKDPNIPVLWVVVGNQNPPANFGKVIRIPECA